MPELRTAKLDFVTTILLVIKYLTVMLLLKNARGRKDRNCMSHLWILRKHLISYGMTNFQIVLEIKQLDGSFLVLLGICITHYFLVYGPTASTLSFSSVLLVSVKDVC